MGANMDIADLKVPASMAENSVFADLCARMGFRPVPVDMKAERERIVAALRARAAMPDERVEIDWDMPIMFVDGAPAQLWQRGDGKHLVGIPSGKGLFRQNDYGVEVDIPEPLPKGVRLNQYQIYVNERGQIWLHGTQLIRNVKPKGRRKPIDWSRPLEMADGTPIVLEEKKQGGCWWIIHEDGKTKLKTTSGTEFSRIAISKEPPFFGWDQGNYPDIRNRRNRVIDWSKPLETEDGREALYEHPIRAGDGGYSAGGRHSIMIMGHQGAGGLWYKHDGTHVFKKSGLPPLRNRT